MVDFTVKEKRGIAFAGLTVLLVVLLGNLPRLAPGVTRFGLEYGCIANSLARGQGFANPFCLPTGPTAWMPPAYAYLMALVFAIFGPLTTASAQVLLMLKVTGLGLAVYLFNLAATYYGLHHKERLSVAMAAALAANFSWVSGELFDRWTTILLSAAVVALLAGWRRWLIPLGLLLPLSHPALTAGLLVVMWTRRGERKWVLPLFLALACSCLFWGVRNTVVVGAPYAIKSNAAYEFYMTNAWDEDGVLSGSTLQRFHPVHPGNQPAEDYRRLGELEFSRLYRDQSFRLVLEAPGTVVLKMLTRARNSLVWVEGPNDLSFVSPRVDERDTSTLSTKGLIRSSAYHQYWLVTEWDEDRLKQALDPLPLYDRRRALRSWRHSKKTVLANKYSWASLLWGFAFAGLPTLAVLVGLKRGGWQHRSFRDPVLLYGAYLVPYILISHYSRYQMGVLGLQVWLVWWVFLRGRWWLTEEEEVQPPAGGSLGGGDE